MALIKITVQDVQGVILGEVEHHSLLDEGDHINLPGGSQGVVTFSAEQCYADRCEQTVRVRSLPN